MNKRKLPDSVASHSPTALALAYYIEAALIERRFFEQLEHQGSNVQKIMSALRRETEEHALKVKEELSRTNQP